MKLATRAAWIGAALAAATPLHAQNYPTRPLRIIVPLSAGGGMDAVARALAQKLTASTGQNVVVDNRPGAGGSIALEMAANSTPDGHTLAVISATSVTHPLLYKARFDVLRDFAPVSQVTRQGYVLVVNPAMPVKSVPELVRHLKANPGKYNFASSGIGSPIHLSGELFMVATGTRMVHVPFKGMGAAYADLVAGNVEISFPTVISSQPHIRSGRLRGLAVTGDKRAPAVAELPTLAEAGVPGVVVTNWYGILAPKATPAGIVRELNRYIVQAMNAPDMQKRLLGDGSEAVGSSPEAFGAHIVAERDKWTRVIREAGIKGM